jgi:hypothetical protein
MEVLIDYLMIYWTSNTIGSSVRYYYEATHFQPRLESGDFVSPPTAVAMWLKDIALAPRELAARLYNVQLYTVFPNGGHFPGGSNRRYTRRTYESSQGRSAPDLKTTPPPLGLFVVTNSPMRKAAPVEGQ